MCRESSLGSSSTALDTDPPPTPTRSRIEKKIREIGRGGQKETISTLYHGRSLSSGGCYLPTASPARWRAAARQVPCCWEIGAGHRKPKPTVHGVGVCPRTSGRTLTNRTEGRAEAEAQCREASRKYYTCLGGVAQICVPGASRRNSAQRVP